MRQKQVLKKMTREKLGKKRTIYLRQGKLTEKRILKKMERKEDNDKCKHENKKRGNEITTKGRRLWERSEIMKIKRSIRKMNEHLKTNMKTTET